MQQNNLTYDGKLSHLYTLWIKNTLFNLLTLYLYRPWAKTHLRKYLYSSISLFGDRFEYTGTGRELFKGMMKATLYLLLVYIVYQLFGIAATMAGMEWVIGCADTFFTPVVILALVYYSQFSALHYRLNRTSWRGIQGRLEGRARTYMLFRLKRLLINIGTLGYTIGRSDLLARRYLISHMSLGNQRCSFDADITSLDRINLITLLLAIPTLGISRLWYKAALLSCYWNNMTAGAVTFEGQFTGGEVCRFTLINLAILVFTLGLGIPFIVQRSMQFLVAHVQVQGTIEGSAILQKLGTATATGEGLASIADYDGLDLDIGLL